MRFIYNKNIKILFISLKTNTRAGLSNVYSVHVHMRPRHIGGPTTRQT